MNSKYFKKYIDLLILFKYFKKYKVNLNFILFRYYIIR